MKKTITLLLFAVICIVGTSNAQRAQSTPIDELLNRLEQIGDNTGSISDYFTQEEQLQLRSYLSKNGVKKTLTQSVEERIDSYNSTLVERTNSDCSMNSTNPVHGTTSTSQNDSTRGVNSITITHNLNETADLEILCTSLDTVADNIAWSEYDLDTDFGITSDFVVTDVTLSIRLGGTNGIPGAPEPMITVNIYSNDGVFPAGNLTLQGTADYTVTSADLDTIVTIPVAATIPFGDNLLYEIVVPDHNPDLGAFRLGVNDPGTGVDSWIVSNACSIVTPTTLTDIGFPSTFIMSVIGDEATGGGGGMAYCAMNVTNEFGSFDPADGSVVTAIGSSPITANFENAGAIDPFDNTTAYVIDNAGDAYSVDVATGVYTSLGNIPGDWLAGEFDPNTGIFYATNSDTNLYTIDFGALTATSVGSTGLIGAIGLAIDGAGNAYTYDINDDNLYGIDLATGAATLIGGIGFDASFGQGMFWDQASDTVFMTAFNNTLFDSELRSVDTATGATTLINQMDASALTQYAWSSTASTPPPPPPCTVFEDFEAGLPAGWATIVNTGSCDWANQMDMPTGDNFTSLAMVFDDDLCGNGADASNVTLLSDAYDTTGATSIMIGYDVAFQESGTQTFTVEVWDGAAWQQIALYDADLDPDIQTITGIDATAYANADFRVRWTYDDNAGEWGWGAGVDNFCLSHDGGATGPSNDECVNAIAVDCGMTYTGETITATDSGGNAANDVWYSYTGTVVGDTVTLSFCDGGTDYDSFVRVFDACGGTEIAFNDDSCGLQSEVQFTSDGATTYYIMVEGFGSNNGNFSMAVDCTTTGVEDNQIAGFNYYPNPTTNVINLSAQSDIETVAIYNVLGQKVVDQNIDATSTSLDVSNLSVGTYIMKVSVDGQVGSYKIVKQ